MVFFNFEKQNKKEDLSDLFKIDIYNIFKYNPQFVEDVTINRKPAKIYTLNVKDLELDTFYKIRIVEFSKGDYNLIFISNINEIRPKLTEFVDFCINVYGPDFMKRGSISPNDIRDLRLGVFSRMWYNTVQIDNLNYKISLTLYNISYKER